MKPLSPLLALSVMLNAAVIGGVAWTVRHPTDHPEWTRWLNGKAAESAASKPAPPAARVAGGKGWAGLLGDGHDMKGLVARLRAAGYPDTVIRAIVQAQIHAKYADKRRELFASVPDTPYWKRKGYAGFDPKLYAASRALDREETSEVKGVLGDDGRNADDFYSYYQRTQYGDLPREKTMAVQDIVGDYNDLRNGVYMNNDGVYLPSDRKQLAYLQQQEQEDLAKVLTPDELLDYEMRTSNTASTLRNQIQAFQPTEAEFKALFQIQQASDLVTGPQYGMLTPAEQQQRQATQQQTDSQIAAALGADRYAQYKQDTDQSYLGAYQVAQRLNLADTVPSQVYAAEQEIQAQAKTIQQNTDLSSSDRQSQLAQLSQQATARVTSLMGSEGLTAYESTPGGFWLRNVSARITRRN